MRLPTCSTTARAPSTASTRLSSSTRPCWTSSINPTPQFNKSVLHLVLDSAVFMHENDVFLGNNATITLQSNFQKLSWEIPCGSKPLSLSRLPPR
jgi:hypothetical protein